jgi:lysozyme family protein
VSAADFQIALAKTLVFEGGKVDDKDDPGGRTNRGVTQHVYDSWRRRKSLPPRDVFVITDAEVQAIYRFQYWDMVKGDDLPSGIDMVVFDGSVHSGPVQSIKWIQRALGTVRVDGVMTAATLAAIEAYPDHDLLVAAAIERRKAFLKALKGYRKYGRGWNSRCDQLLKLGQEHASGSYGSQPTYLVGMDARAYITDAKTAPSPAVADAVTGGGLFATAVDQITTALNPLANTLPTVGTVVGVVTAVGGLAATGGFLYRTWATRKAHALADALDARPVAFLAPAAIPPAADDAPAPAPTPDPVPLQPAAAPDEAAIAVHAMTPGAVFELPPGSVVQPATVEDPRIVAFHEVPHPAEPAPVTELPSAPDHLVALPGVH